MPGFPVRHTKEETDVEEKLPAPLDADTIQKRFLLSREDLKEVRRCRGPVLRLCYAVQLCVLRWRGHFLKDIREVPWPVFECVAQQLGMLALPWNDFLHNDIFYEEQTRQDQMQRLRRYLGFVRCDAAQRQALLDHLLERAQMTAKVPPLQAAALEWLTQNKVVRPGPTTLLDLIQTARERGLQRVFEKLTHSLSAQQRQTLEDLLLAREEGGRSLLEQFKAPARQESPEAFQELAGRLTAIQAIGMTDLPQLT